MTSLRRTRILVVANRTAAAHRLLNEVRRRAKSARCEFVLLIPTAGRGSADWTLETALPLLRRAALGPVEGMVSDPDAWSSVRTVVAAGDFDEIIVSTRPPAVSKWLRRDLLSRTRRLGLPVTAISPRGGRHLNNKEAAKTMLEGSPGSGPSFW